MSTQPLMRKTGASAKRSAPATPAVFAAVTTAPPDPDGPNQVVSPKCGAVVGVRD
jgi:hypothetical protein